MKPCRLWTSVTPIIISFNRSSCSKSFNSHKSSNSFLASWIASMTALLQLLEATDAFSKSSSTWWQPPNQKDKTHRGDSTNQCKSAIIGSFCCCFLCCKCRNLRRCSAKSSTALDSSAAKLLRSSAKSKRLTGDDDLDGMGQTMYSIFLAPWSLMLWLFWYIPVVMQNLGTKTSK